MSISASVLENLAVATGLSRQTISEAMAEVEITFSARLVAMRQRISGIMAQGSQGNGNIGAVIEYTDEVVTVSDKAKIFAGLGLGLIGGFLLAAAAGEIVVVLVALLCLAGVGLLLKSFLMELMKRAMDAIDRVKIALI